MSKIDFTRAAENINALRGHMVKKDITSAKELWETYGDGLNPDVTSRNASAIADAYACIKVLAESVAQLPMQMFRRDGDNRVETEDDPYFVVAVQPNEFQTALEYYEMLVEHLATTGNHYSWKNVVRDELRELIPLDPHSVSIEKKTYDEVIFRVAMLDEQGHTVSRLFDSSQIFHVRLMGQDGFTGMSPIERAASAFSASKLMSNFGAKLYENLVRPSGVLSSDLPLDKDQVDLLRTEWAKYKGADNVGETPILSGGLKWTQTQLSSTDAQFIEGMRFNREQICGIFRVPPHFLSDMSHATFSNIENLGTQFVQYTLAPYLTRIESRIRKDLLTIGRSRRVAGKFFVKFNTNAMMRGDSESRASFYRTMREIGAMNANEVREMEDMPPRQDAGGETYLEPMNMQGANDGDDDEPAPQEETQDEAEETRQVADLRAKRVTAEYDSTGRFKGATIAQIK